jgi:hypothetical protein
MQPFAKVFYLSSLSTLHLTSSSPHCTLVQALTVITKTALASEMGIYTLQPCAQQISHLSHACFTLAPAISVSNFGLSLTH